MQPVSVLYRASSNYLECIRCSYCRCFAVSVSCYDVFSEIVDINKNLTVPLLARSECQSVLWICENKSVYKMIALLPLRRPSHVI